MSRQIRILWIDDEVCLLKPFILFLQEKGHDIETVTNGSDGISKVASGNYDLILLDEMMPGLDGLTTLQEIKKVKPEVKVVMVTKNEEEGLMEKAIASYIADYLIKPVNPSQILMTIKKLFNTEEIISNKAGEEYSKFISDINSKISQPLNWKEWADIYLNICKWDINIDELRDQALKQTHFLQKKNCNTEFSNYVEKNYQHWLKVDDRPVFSFDVVSNYILPEIDKGKTVYFLLLDCLRLDQYLVLEPLIREFFDINLDLYYSILPTATPYSRNSIFSGLLPIDIADRFPEYWSGTSDLDKSRNRNEHQLLDEHIEDLGYELNPKSKYIKVFNIEEGNFVLRKISSYKQIKNSL